MTTTTHEDCQACHCRTILTDGTCLDCGAAVTADAVSRQKSAVTAAERLAWTAEAIGSKSYHGTGTGITLRQHFAGLMMAAILSGEDGDDVVPSEAAAEAVTAADALLLALARK